jgi:hypothetical protein
LEATGVEMKRARFSEEQIIGILKAAETSGNIRSCCAEHNITGQPDAEGPELEKW